MQAIDDYKPLYNDGQMKDMDEQYGKVMGPGSQEEFDMDKLGDGAAGEGGWTMSDEYDAPSEEYGDDRPDADKVSGTCLCQIRWAVGSATLLSQGAWSSWGVWGRLPGCWQDHWQLSGDA